MYAVNTVNLIGRLTDKPQIRVFENGKKKASFTLAVNSYKGGSGKANFLNCEAWEKTAENLNKLGEKGVLVGITGSLQQQIYTSESGNKINRIIVLASNFEKLSSPAQKVEQEANAYDMTNNIATINSYEEVGTLQENYADQIDLGSDDLPF